jgi:hypothetical protein
MKLPNWVIPGSAVFFLGACTALLSPIEQSRSIATQAGFTEVRLPDARLRAYLKHQADQRLAGSRRLPSISRATEHHGGFRMNRPPTRHRTNRWSSDGSIGPRRAVAYLGRPCQYLEFEAELATCNPALWMLGRFSEDAVAASNQAISRIKGAPRSSGSISSATPAGARWRRWSRPDATMSPAW